MKTHYRLSLIAAFSNDFSIVGDYRNNTTVNQNWKSVIFSDETQVVLGTDDRVYVWRKTDEKWRPECLGMRSVRNGGSRISV